MTFNDYLDRVGGAHLEICPHGFIVQIDANGNEFHYSVETVVNHQCEV